MEKLEPIDLSYGTGQCKSINDKFRMVSELRNSINSSNNEEIFNKLNNCDESEIVNMINLLSNLITEDLSVDNDKIQFIVGLCDKLYDVITSKKYYNQKMLDEIPNLIKQIKLFYQVCYSKVSDKSSVVKLSNDVTQIIGKLKDIIFKCNGINESPKKVNMLEVPKNDILNESGKNFVNDKGEQVPKFCPKCGSKISIYLCGEPVYKCSDKKCGKCFGVVPFSNNESTILNTTSQKIYSEFNPNGTNIVGKNQTQYNPDENVINLIKTDDEKLMMAKLPEIYKYYDKIKDSLDANNIDIMKSAMYHIYNVLINNNSGLQLFKEQLLNIISSIDANNTSVNIVLDDHSDSKPANQYLKSFINKIIKDIDERISNNSSSDTDDKYDLLAEMGCAFIYEFPEVLDESTVMLFNEAVDRNLPDDFLDDITNNLTESIFKKSDYEIAKKAERKEAKKAQKHRDRDVMMYKGKALTLTNATARTMMNTLKRAIAAVIAGGATTVIFNKQYGLIVAALTFISTFCKSKLRPSTERSRLALELKAELEIIDTKIDEMERQGDIKNKAKLMRVKARMQECYNRIINNLSSGDLAWI